MGSQETTCQPHSHSLLVEETKLEPRAVGHQDPIPFCDLLSTHRHHHMISVWGESAGTPVFRVSAHIQWKKVLENHNHWLLQMSIYLFSWGFNETESHYNSSYHRAFCASQADFKLKWGNPPASASSWDYLHESQNIPKEFLEEKKLFLEKTGLQNLL